MASPRARVAAGRVPRARLQIPVRSYAPSLRSLAVGLGLLAIAVGGYGAARETSAFAVDRIAVTGGSPQVDAQVRRTLASFRGTTLLALNGAALVRRVEALPTVVAAGYDRAFPHTLRIAIVPERPVAVVRQGATAWIVSARGRVIRPVRPHGAHGLARIWVPRTTTVAVGGFLPAGHGAAVARSLALASSFPAHIALAALRSEGLMFRLRDGVEVRLGEPTDIRLKLAVARRALPRMPSDARYLDVSVPGRPVAGSNPQLSGRD